MDKKQIPEYLKKEDHVVFSPDFNVPREAYNNLQQRQTLIETLKETKAAELTQLETEISQQMLTLLKAKHQQPIIYLDVAQKPEHEDIMFFIFKNWIEQSSQEPEKVLELLNRESSVMEGSKEQINNLEQYTNLLNTFIKEKSKEVENAENMILNFEGESYKEIIGKMTTSTPLFLFIDNASPLTVQEHIRINDMLSRRETLGRISSITPYLKINNGQGKRQTFHANNNRPMQNIHDYCHMYIDI